MADIVDIAAREIGIGEYNNGHMKYIGWYGGFGRNTAWCAIFVSWCANQAGVSTSVIPKYSLVSAGMAWYQRQGRFKKKGYQPKRGDIVFFKERGRSHTGIVERSDGSRFYTIEGNSTNDRVTRRNYLLNEDTLTGFGIPNYSNSPINSNNSNNSSGSSSSGGSNELSDSEKRKREQEKQKEEKIKKEIAYLKKAMKKKKPEQQTAELQAKRTGVQGKNVQILITIKKKHIEFPTLDGINLVYDRKGSPGKLTFKVLYSEKYQIEEGNPVLLSVDKKSIFFGFVFTREMDKERTISITAYDQLRYLKNRDFINYTKKTTGQLIEIIAKNYHLQVGTLADTKCPISRVENDVTLLDMIQNSLDETLMETGEVYTLYDEVGKITLKHIKDMKENNCFLCEETAENFSYKSSIDSDVYNQIKLGYENKETGKMESLEGLDVENVNKWGVLQYFEKVDNKKIRELKIKALLKYYNRRAQTLSVNGVFGNVNIKGGSLIPVVLNLGDIKVSNYMLVEKVTHKFNAGNYKMDLILSGGDFNG